MENDLRLGFIGAGNIAQALIQGFLNSNYIKPDQISVAAPSNTNLDIFEKLGCHVTNENKKIFNHILRNDGEIRRTKFNYILFICVKPTVSNNDFWTFLGGKDFHAMRLYDYQLTIISSMAGVPMNHLIQQIIDAKIGYQVKLTMARIMPNTACSTRNGVVGLSIAKQTENLPIDIDFPEIQLSEITKLLDQLGSCFLVPENQLDAVCGLSGSGIAFVYTFIQAMADGGVLVGLSRSLSTQITLQTIMGATKMVEESKTNPMALRDLVCSPAGTTIHGIHALEKGSFNCTVMDAIKAATELSKAFSKSPKI